MTVKDILDDIERRKKDIDTLNKLIQVINYSDYNNDGIIGRNFTVSELEDKVNMSEYMQTFLKRVVDDLMRISNTLTFTLNNTELDLGTYTFDVNSLYKK